MADVLADLRALLASPHLAADIRTLRNGGEDDPQWEEDTCDGEVMAWDIYVADGQVVCTVPYNCHSGGEPSDGGPLDDWRDAICRAGATMAAMHGGLAAAAEEIERLRAAGLAVSRAWVVTEAQAKDGACADCGRAVDDVAALRTERDRLARILAVEQGNAAKAPPGWSPYGDTMWRRGSHVVQRMHDGEDLTVWTLRGYRRGDPGAIDGESALEVMEAVDARELSGISG